jgi:hypothetical protein
VTAAVRWIDVPALAGASAHAAQAVDADLAFAHPAIRGVAAIDRTGGRVAVVAEPADPRDDRDDLDDEVRRAVTASVASFRLVGATAPVWRRAAPSDAAALAGFVADAVLELGPGQYALRGPAARLRAALDRRLAALAATVEAEPWHLPSVESTADLLRATGYFASHPQHVTWGFHLPPRFAALRDFAREAKRGELAAPAVEQVQPTGFILEPFVCHNVYRALRGAAVARGRAITALGNCYRFEGHRFAPLERQWEFSMREVVMLGPPAYVDDTRARLIAATQALCAELDLDAELEPATDPFFAAEAAGLRTFQAMNATKLELRLAIGGGRRLAAASFNLCGRCFSGPMHIHADRDLADTGCVGWGLERWMAAVVARWGGDPSAWPATLGA